MIKTLQQQADKYALKAQRLLASQNLPPLWRGELDHVAWKASNSDNYESIIEAIKADSIKIVEVDLDQRRIAVATLTGPIALRDFGSTSSLEIIEPKPGRAGKDYAGLQHAEFQAPSLVSVWGWLNLEQNRRKIMPPKFERNIHHEWVSLPMRGGQEIKFTNRSLAEMQLEQVTSGEARELQL
jgi:hypothetical protein